MAVASTDFSSTIFGDAPKMRPGNRIVPVGWALSIYLLLSLLRRSDLVIEGVCSRLHPAGSFPTNTLLWEVPLLSCIELYRSHLGSPKNLLFVPPDHAG